MLQIKKNPNNLRVIGHGRGWEIVKLLWVKLI